MYLSTSFDSDQQVVTNNATEIVAFTIPIPDRNTCSVAIRILARGFDDGVSALWFLGGCVKGVSGTVTIISGISDLITPKKDAGATLWTAQVTASGTNLEVRVKGAALQDVGWVLEGGIWGFRNVGATV